MVVYSLGVTLALPSAPSSPSVPSALPGLSVDGVPPGEEMGLDAACREDSMVRKHILQCDHLNIFNSVTQQYLFFLSIHVFQV